MDESVQRVLCAIDPSVLSMCTIFTVLENFWPFQVPGIHVDGNCLFLFALYLFAQDG
jgi:hypothetical protein